MKTILAAFLLSSGAAVATPPNFVVIMTDDQTLDQMAALPTVQAQIGAKGMQFAQAYQQTALCSVSRSSFLTGKYAQNTGVTTNGIDDDGGAQLYQSNGNEENDLPVWLNNAGYTTGLVGKYINGYSMAYTPHGWSYWAGTDNIYPQYNYDIYVNGRSIHYGTATSDYGTDVLRGYALDFLKTAKEPFFLDVTPTAPHQHRVAAQRHLGLYQGSMVPRTPAFNEADVSDKPPFLQFPAMSSTLIATRDRRYGDALRMLAAVDEMVGAIVAQLQAKGQLGRTYLIFTSDNGFHYGQHRLDEGKDMAYETDIHLPLMIRGPAVLPGTTDTEHMVLNVDLAPTILTLAGVPLPAGIDGRSFHRLLRGAEPGSPWRQAFPLAHDYRSQLPWEPPYRGVRTERFKLVQWDGGAAELYDLQADPYEVDNLVGHLNADQVGVQAALTVLSAQLATCAGAACRQLESAAAP